jgi:hypothetical protein
MEQLSSTTPVLTPTEMKRITTAWLARQQHQWSVTALRVLECQTVADGPAVVEVIQSTAELKPQFGPAIAWAKSALTRAPTLVQAPPRSKRLVAGRMTTMQLEVTR